MVRVTAIEVNCGSRGDRSEGVEPDQISPNPTDVERVDTWIPEPDMLNEIRQILLRVGNLSSPAASLAEESDLYDAGLTSFASVQLMLALEDAFDIEFPERMLTRKTFASLGSIARSIGELTPQKV
jgi:acyl carrier protein